LRLAPHPEGGHFRETFRDTVLTAHGRAASTAIYFLLRAGEATRWHRIDAAELWHWYGGASVELSLAEDGALATIRLGPALDTGERPQAVVPAGTWQRAVSLGAFSLMGCTVAPGFEFAHFELAAGEGVPATGRTPSP